jgi:apolipoprotein N-acyltransferase
LVAASASCIVLLICNTKKFFPVVVLILISLTAIFVNPMQWSENSGKPLIVGVVQGNVPIDKKWQPQYRDKVIAKLRSMSNTLITQQADLSVTLDLLIWPETGLPLSIQQTNEQFWRDIVPNQTTLLAGILDFPNVQENYNAAVLNCDSEQKIYRKRHLVPFGEYLPLRFLFNWVLEYLQLPMTDFTAWEDPQSLSCDSGIKIGLSICYEDAFASEMRRTSGDATLLVNISEDAWFGDSFAPHQRLQMGQMRAKELSRPMARSANSGPSALIDHRGNVLAKTSQFVEAALVGVVQPQVGETPYKRFGNWIVWISILSVVFLGLHRRRLNAKYP